MPKFQYSAVNASGKQVNGDFNAPNEAAVVDMLRRDGFFATKITKTGGFAASFSGPSKKMIKPKVLASFCTQMAAMLRAGVPISKTLEIMRDQSEDKTLQYILTDVYEMVHKGSTLSESLRNYSNNLPVMFLSMVEAGEVSGALDSCIERAGISFARNAKLNSKVKGAMIYPSIILVVLLGLLVLLLVVIIPSFTEMYEESGVELPGFTKMLIASSDFLKGYWFILVPALVGLVVGVRTYLKTDSGRTTFDKKLLGIPKINKLLKKIYAARFARTLSSLSSAGVPLTQSLKITARSVINRHMEKELYKVVDAINRGERLSAPIERMDLLPPMVTFMIRSGEESGTMDSLLEKAAEFFDDESDAAISAMVAMLEPLLIIVMAAIVVPVLLGALMPMFNMVNMMMD